MVSKQMTLLHKSWFGGSPLTNVASTQDKHGTEDIYGYQSNDASLFPHQCTIFPDKPTMKGLQFKRIQVASTSRTKENRYEFPAPARKHNCEPSIRSCRPDNLITPTSIQINMNFNELSDYVILKINKQHINISFTILPTIFFLMEQIIEERSRILLIRGSQVRHLSLIKVLCQTLQECSLRISLAPKPIALKVLEQIRSQITRIKNKTML